MTQSDMRVLQTEIGTRGRLSQLERWNAGAFELSAPGAKSASSRRFPARTARAAAEAGRFPDARGARFGACSRTAEAARRAGGDRFAVPTATTPSALLHEASLKTETREVPAATPVIKPQTAVIKSADKPVTAAKPAQMKSSDKPGLAAAQSHLAKSMSPEKKSVDKPALGLAKPMTKHVELAKNDPLAPLPAKHPGKPKDEPPAR